MSLVPAGRIERAILLIRGDCPFEVANCDLKFLQDWRLARVATRSAARFFSVRRCIGSMTSPDGNEAEARVHRL